MMARNLISAQSFKNFFVMLVAAAFVAVLAGCAGAGTKTGEYVDDSVITTKVKSAFAADKTVSALRVHVVTVDGNVRLSGFVKSSEEKRRAEEVARSVAGVTGVTNGLTIRSN